MDKIREKLRGHAAADSMEVDAAEDAAGDIDTLVNNCKFNMKLEMADSAWKQVRKQLWVLLLFFCPVKCSHRTHLAAKMCVFRITSPLPPSC